MQNGGSRDPGDHPYTSTTLAEFLGWQKPSGGPSEAIEITLGALEMIERGVLDAEGRIELPEVPDDTNRRYLRYAPGFIKADARADGPEAP